MSYSLSPSLVVRVNLPPGSPATTDAGSLTAGTLAVARLDITIRRGLAGFSGTGPTFLANQATAGLSGVFPLIDILITRNGARILTTWALSPAIGTPVTDTDNGVFVQVDFSASTNNYCFYQVA